MKRSVIGALQAVERLSLSLVFFLNLFTEREKHLSRQEKRYRNEGIAKFLQLKESAARVHIGGCSFLSLSVRKRFFFFSSFLDVRNAVDIAL